MLPINLAGHKSRKMQSEQKIINQLNYTDMLTLRQFITNYCESNNLISNNVPNDTFIGNYLICTLI